MTLIELLIIAVILEAVQVVVIYCAGHTDGYREGAGLCRHSKRHGDCLPCWVKGIR